VTKETGFQRSRRESRREAKRQKHRDETNWLDAAYWIVFNHEYDLADDEGWDESVHEIRARTIRDEVLRQIGVDRFTEFLIVADFEMSKRNKEAVLDRALEESGYNSARQRLFPPGTEITEYGAWSQELWWSWVVEDLAEMRAEHGAIDDWGVVHGSFIEYLTMRSRLEAEQPDLASRITSWYPTTATPAMTRKDIELLGEQGAQPSPEAAARHIDRLLSAMGEAR
jgi:hypothetical protein